MTNSLLGDKIPFDEPPYNLKIETTYRYTASANYSSEQYSIYVLYCSPTTHSRDLLSRLRLSFAGKAHHPSITITEAIVNAENSLIIDDDILAGRR